MKPICLILTPACYFSLLNENVVFKSVLRSLSNICHGVFLPLKTVNYFCKKTPSCIVERVLNIPLILIFP